MWGSVGTWDFIEGQWEPLKGLNQGQWDLLESLSRVPGCSSGLGHVDGTARN